MNVLYEVYGYLPLAVQDEIEAKGYGDKLFYAGDSFVTACRAVLAARRAKAVRITLDWRPR